MVKKRGGEILLVWRRGTLAAATAKHEGTMMRAHRDERPTHAAHGPT
ncbi:hypothetical protein predicted by Glimmer/Critica [Acetobacter senegalensis]|uniref:Uncharacterized protein n=1 Tax=Acetobacter senegalensis TaxID=446692 RepID=A0A0U5ERN1_9PROT|nr:hypothetical protein predicted by Glimmer/Critica [Acetobacter senegalensis]